MDTAARRICETNPNFSADGKFCVSPYTIFANAIPFCQTQGLYNSGVLFSCQRFYPKPRHPSLITCHSPSNPSNSSRAFARASRSQRQKSSKDIFVPPASSRARTGQHFDLCREQRAAVSRQEIRKFHSAFPACDRENLRTSRF